ncbi:1-aminocyclopropane-1-carboxylate deaminase/D-cysteine desulfhydrase [Nonomuraea sp. C10]|uniref:1-aminocyclopropane-1-carboxylate deaminase/D-cysteine desulfhydrase n=1 Tax=Nonomuraea sp. C10 TaxID=2600577 RepID=UPI0011CEC8BC|nr:pyridoxal-phosphate dependent enzyme [Nonomuraea sp. C10]TXK35241.1 pyridoxal-phosphate dependent enzyme [Nonomuraea sp. C10]TXK36545.1 pyridoxal-phosphate dependent enzyme [Nonomuraea sp. C10]
MAVTPDHRENQGVAPPRAELAVLPTPLVEAPRLAEALDVRGRMLLKRDDLTGFAVAGNKARQLEMLIAAARESGARVLVTGGTPGSNFCQAAAAAAAWAGLRCVLIYAGSPPQTSHPNLLAARHWGAEIRWTHDPDRAFVDVAIERAAGELGQTAFAVPRGGATPLGATGFHLAALELATQLVPQAAPQPGEQTAAQQGPHSEGRSGAQAGAHVEGRLVGPVVVVVAAGSGGTQAGLVSGAVASGRRMLIRGASVSRPPDETARRILELGEGCARLMGTEIPEASDVVVEDARGPGHARPSEEGERAARLALRASGVVLDPVYTAKALGALPRILGERRHDPDLTTVLWHTGGLLDAVAGWEAR